VLPELRTSDRGGKPAVECYQTSNGVLIFRLPMEVFAGYIAYAHLIVAEGAMTLIDAGSGLGTSHHDLVAGFEVVRGKYGVKARLEDLDRIIITHGHIDHFGGLAQVKEIAARAKVGIHELDRTALANYDERVLVTSRRLAEFLQRAGVPAERFQPLLDMYMIGKRGLRPVPVDFILRDGEMIEGLLETIHVPGHTPGLVMIRVDDVLLTADHILPQTSVVLAPESLMAYTGVGHYLESLQRAAKVDGVRLALGGHEQAMDAYHEVVQRTYAASIQKIERVLEECGQPSTIYELACRIYGCLDGYAELLKIEQIGARVEYLHQRGQVMIENLDALEHDGLTPIRYTRMR